MEPYSEKLAQITLLIAFEQVFLGVADYGENRVDGRNNLIVDAVIFAKDLYSNYKFLYNNLMLR